MNRRAFLLTTAGAVLPVRGICAEDQVGSWPVWRGNAAMQGFSAKQLKLPLKLAWKFEAAKPIKATCVSDGAALFVGDGKGKFFCVDLKSGKARWEFSLKDPIEGSAAVLADRVVFGCTDGRVYCLEKATGKLLWKFETEAEIKGGVNLYQPAGRPAEVLVGSYDNRLYVLDSANGKKLHAIETSNYINGSAALAGKQALFGGCDGFLYLVNVESGQEEGKIEIKDPIANTVTTDMTRAYVCHYGRAAVAVDLKSRESVWTYKEKQFDYFASPALTDRFLITADRGKYVRCLNRENGEEVWAFKAGGSVDSSPVVAGNHVFFGADDGLVYGLNLADGKVVWSYEIGPPVQSSPCIAGGRLVIGADNGVIYCFES